MEEVSWLQPELFVSLRYALSLPQSQRALTAILLSCAVAALIPWGLLVQSLAEVGANRRTFFNLGLLLCQSPSPTFIS